MGSISRMVRSRRSQPGAIDGANELAVGNPAWSAQGSQDQFEAAAAARRLQGAQRSATRTLNQARFAGADIDDPRFDQIEETAAKGFAEEALTLGGNMLSWLRGPFAAVQIGLQDILGGAPAEGKTSPTFGDYVDALFGDLEDESEFAERTGLSTSGSDLLSILGWEEAADDDWVGRIMRGVGHFTLDMLTDPLTYVTFGMAGLGRKVVQQGAKVFQNTTVKNVTRFLDDAAAAGATKADDVARLARNATDLNPYERDLAARASQLADDLALREPELVAQLGMEGLPTAAAARQMALEEQIVREVIRPALMRDFGSVHAKALAEVPGYMRGGIRLSVAQLPFMPRNIVNQKAIVVPGTVGLGRKMIGDPIRRVHTSLKQIGGYDTLANRLKQIRKGSDTHVALFDGLVDGTMTPWQWTMASAAADGIHNLNQTQAAHAYLDEASNLLQKTADDAGIDMTDMLSSLHRRVESSEALEALPEFSPEIDDQLNTWAARLQDMYSVYYRRMADLDPDYAAHYIDGYIPHLPSDDGREFVGRLLEAGAATGLEAMGHGDDMGRAFFARIAAGMGHAGNTAIDEAMGSVRFVDRQTGRLAVQSMSVDGGPIMLSQNFMAQLIEDGVVNPDAIVTEFLTSQEINNALEPVLRSLADEFNVPLPRKWDGRFLSENPIELARTYTQSMNDAIQQWQMVRALETAKLVVRQNKVVDTPAVIQNLRTNALSMADTVAGEPDRIAFTFREALDVMSTNSRRELGKLGLDASEESVAGVGMLHQRLYGSTKQGFRQWGRGAIPEEMAGDHIFDIVNEWPRMNTTSVVSENNLGELTIMTNLDTGQHVINLNLPDVSLDLLEDQRAAREQIIDALDREFTEGVLKGQLTADGIDRLFLSGAVSENTSDLLYDYLGRKMNAIDGEFLEHALSPNPVEVNSARWLFDEWESGVQDFINTYSTRYSQAGERIPGQILGDSITQQKLDELASLGESLKRKGVHEVAEIMSRVQDHTVGNQLKGYLNPQRLGLGGKALDDMLVEQNAAMFLRNMASNTQVLNTPEGIKAAKMATADFLKSWRGLVTLARPTFHIRNAIGAAWMNSLMGVKGASYRRLNAGIHKFREGLFEVIDDADNVRPFTEMLDHAISKIDPADQVAFRKMWDEGVLSGFVDTEFRTHFDKLGQEGPLDWLNAWDTDRFFLTKWGGNLMQNIEDYARGSLFLEYFDEAVEGSEKVARDVVNAIHFDYNNLTPWETKVKSWVPFFVWTRRNIPRQLSMMIENPGMVNKYQHMMEALNDNLGGRDETGFPHGDHFSASVAGTDYFVNPGTPFWARVMIDPDLPVTDLLEIPNPLSVPEMIDFANGQLGPHVTALFDINESREFGDVNAPAPFNAVLRSLAAAGFLDATPDGDVRINYWARTIMELALPFAREVVDPLTGGPTDPGRQQRLGIEEDDEFLESTLKALGFTLARGAGVKLSTPTDARQVNARNREEIRQIINELQMSGDL